MLSQASLLEKMPLTIKSVTTGVTYSAGDLLGVPDAFDFSIIFRSNLLSTESKRMRL